MSRHVSEAFDRYIGDQGPAFVPTALITPFDAIEIIHGAGGVAVWAHPRPDALQTALAAFVAHGLDGIECYRPRLTHGDTERISGCRHGRGAFCHRRLGLAWRMAGRLGDFAIERDDVARFLDIGGI
jgi:hypothetical protein